VDDQQKIIRAAEAAGEIDPLSFDLNRFLPYLLNRSGVRLATAFSNELERFKLTLPMWRVMAVLWHKGDQRVTDVGEETTIEQSTLSRLLAAMDDRGLVGRNRDRPDARVVMVSLTAKGRAVTDQLIPLALRNEGVALKGFSAEEIRTLHSMLHRIFHNAAELLR
jgi:MarR family transcriptional regulator, organic hydroperoxide resistance regulator